MLLTPEKKKPTAGNNNIDFSVFSVFIAVIGDQT